MIKRILALFTASVVFIALIVLAIHYQSANFLYAASALPILIVLLIPDVRSNQYIKPQKHKGQVHVYRTTGKSGPELLVITFQPGYIHWNKHIVYFQADDVPAADQKTNDPFTATFSVLKFDLVRHPRKPQWIGIRLAHLRERSKSLSFTIDEVNRFVIRMEDIREIAGRPAPVTSAANKNVQA